MEFSLKEIASIINGVVDGDPSTKVTGFATIESAVKGQLTFLHNMKYEAFLNDTKASVVIISKEYQPKAELATNYIRVDDPYTAMGELLSAYEKMTGNQKVGIEQPSFQGANSKLGTDVYLGAFAYLGENCNIGDRTKIYPNVFIGDNVSVGADSVIHPGAKIYHGCVIGNHCEIHAGAVIGSDGFGFAPQIDGSYKAIPQVGNVVLGDHVYVGANTTIDRATLESTKIGDGSKLDNLVQLGHNVEIGKHTVIASQTGIAGSTKVGDHCVFGGQVGVAGHITIANKTSVGAQSGVLKSTKEGDVLFGTFALDHKQFMRSFAIYRKLPDVYSRLGKVEKAIEHMGKSE